MNVTLVVGGILSGMLVLVGYLYASSLEENARLKNIIELERENNKILSNAINTQNKKIKELEVVQSKEPETIKEVEKIVLKDSSCESLIKGYKDIFKELGK